jgi:hypothetical protein
VRSLDLVDSIVKVNLQQPKLGAFVLAQIVVQRMCNHFYASGQPTPKVRPANEFEISSFTQRFVVDGVSIAFEIKDSCATSRLYGALDSFKKLG